MQMTKKAGFTLIEMVIVMAIIGALMYMLLPTVMRRWQSSDISKYKLQLGNIKQGLIDFKVATGNYPTEKEGLSILADQEKYKKLSSGAEAPLKEKDILDQNDTPIIYHLGKQTIKNKDKYNTFELLWLGTGDSEETAQLSDGQ